ncbi:hypothetical protein Hanom_Chr12g01081831 [Helianthus anomalus]
MVAASASFTRPVFKSNLISTNSAIFAGVRTFAFNVNTASSVHLQRSLGYSPDLQRRRHHLFEFLLRRRRRRHRWL